ncbi:MAG: cbb3-type cytochrome oxidase assembly protein CcoS [Bacteroidetes bacterium]|nr:cbb3-type cytochrome oxidase assembly protein CcoS [Bacteroidota bacterium]
MSVIFLLLTVSTFLASVFLFAFIRAVRKGQYDDDRSPAVRILMDDPAPVRKAGAAPAPHLSGRYAETAANTTNEHP